MANQFLGRADTSGNSEKLNAQAPNYYLDFNNFTPTTVSVAANNITRRPIISTVINNSIGYITRAAIGMQRGTAGWGEALFSVGNNDAGTSFVDFRFNTNGRIYSPAGTFALTGEAQPANGGNAATANSAAKWTTARTLTLTGHATGSVSIDGSANVSINVNNNYASSSNSANFLVVPDTRATNPAPTEFSKKVQFDFKSLSSISLPGTGNYGGLMTFAPYSDASGGNKYQLGFSYSGSMPYISARTAAGGASSWSDWAYIPAMNQTNGYWGFLFPSNNTYLRTPPNGLLPYASGTSNSTVLGTSSWRFNSAYINTVYGNLSGNATTATTATNATQLGGVGASGYLRNTGGVLTGSTASISRAATGASWVTGRSYAIFKMTSSSNYSPIWSAKTINGSWDCGTYTSDRLYFSYITDTNFNAGTNAATGQFYVDTDGSITAPAFKGNATSATTATNSNQLGGIAAASYINTSDTLILRGVV